MNATRPLITAINDRVNLAELTDYFATTAASHDRESSFPFDNFARLQQAGLLGLATPRRLGGGGADLAMVIPVIQAVARGEPATALILVMQYIFHAALDRSAWPEPVRQRLADGAIQRGELVNALRVEPELGAPARGGLPATIARRTAEGWRLSGHKIYSTGSVGLSWFAVHARSDDENPVIGTWLVSAQSSGIHIEESWDHHGLRASASHDVIFDNVLVPEDFVLAAPIEASRHIDMETGRWLTTLLAALYDAVAQSAKDWFVKWTIDRKPANLGASLATLPRFQEAIGTMENLLLSNRLLLQAAANNVLAPGEYALVKHSVTENAITAVETAIRLAGNPGLSRHNPLERHYRDVLCGRIHSPQADAILIAAGKSVVTAATALNA